MYLKTKFVFLDGKLCYLNEASVNITNPSFNYGVNVFEVVRCYWNEKKGRLYAFMLKEHINRLFQSCKLLQLNLNLSTEDIIRSFKEVIKINGFREDLVVRICVYLKEGTWYNIEPTGLIIIPTPRGRVYQEKKGIKCKVSSWRRISDSCMPPRIKAGANYVNSRLAQIEAISNGYDTAIFINDNSKIAETTSASLFIVRNKQLITSKITDSILEGITRKVVMCIAKNDLNIEVIEREIDRTELYLSDEIFLCGTTTEIVPIISIDKIPIYNEKVGPITQNIMSLFFKIVRNEYPKYQEWLTDIYEY